MKRLALGILCASALTCGGPVIGDDQDPAKLFESLDKNGDGTLGPDEVSEDRRRFFERLVRVGDKNDDRKLSRDEFVAAMTAEERPVETPQTRFGRGGDRPMFSPGQMFDRMDRDKDGKFAKSEIPEQLPGEMRERLERVFTAAGKSEVTKEEFEKVMAQYGPPRGPEGRRPGPERDGDRPRADAERGREMAREGEREREAVREGDRRPGPEREGDRPRPEGERGREIAREGDRRPGPEREGERPPRGPEGERMERGGDRPEGREGFRGFGMRDGGRPAPALIRVLDRDENGKLSRREIARIVDRFDELDRNEDGELDAQELIGLPFGGGSFSGFGRFGEGMRREGFDRGREMAREGDRRPEGPRDGDRPRPEGFRDGERRPEGPRDGDRPRPESERDGDRPRFEGRPGGRPEGRPEGGPRGERGPGRERPGEPRDRRPELED